MNPKISIVLPTYNGEKYIQESIDSILAQTLADWELILVDDCSTDRTAEILEQYAVKDTRISVVHNEVNQKLPKSLNIGFARAKGNYLTWTSDDNRYLPNALEIMAEYLEKNQETMIVRGNYCNINAQGEEIGRPSNYLSHTMFSKNCFGACFLYRKEVRELVGEYNTDAFGVEDYDYWLRILEKFGRIDSIDQVLYEYRRHEDSLSETKSYMILCELARLRERHKEKILEELKEDKAELCKIYYEMLPLETFGQEIRNDFRRTCTELMSDLGFTDRKPFIIFGAGVYGERAVALLKDKAAYFTDNDMTKVGKVKCGRKVIAFGKAKELSRQYDFFIAMYHSNLYDAIKQLKEAGITQYTTLQSYTEGRKSKNE